MKKLIGIATLIICEAMLPCRAAEIECSIISRYKLDQIKVQGKREHNVSGIEEIRHAPNGNHFELIRLQVVATWDTDKKKTNVRFKPELLANEKKLKHFAKRNIFGEYLKSSSSSFSLRHQGDEKSTAIRELVFLVPDDADSLVLNVNENHSLVLPKTLQEGAPPETTIRGSFKLLKSELKNQITTMKFISHNPKVEEQVDWKLNAGQFLIAEVSAALSDSIPNDISIVTLTPNHFGIQLVDGSVLKPTGILTRDEITGESYPMNIHRNSKGLWPNHSFKLIFVVHKPAKDFQILFLPRQRNPKANELATSTSDPSHSEQ